MSALQYSKDHPLRVAMAGFGNVGRTLAPRLVAGEIPEVRLMAIAAKDLDKARQASADLSPRPLIVPVAELPRHADVVVECATYEAFPEIARATVTAGKTLVAVSAGALGAHPELVDLARRHGGVIRIACGAMPGLDIIRSAREGGQVTVKLTSRIRPDSLASEPYILGQGFDFSTPPAQAVKVFTGSARQAAQAFPRHYNVAVTLSLAGAGLDATAVEVWCDPAIPGAVHHVEVGGEIIDLILESRNRPSPTNRNTSRIVAPSIMAALRTMVSPLVLGS